MLAGLTGKALWRHLLGASKAVEFIHLDGVGCDLSDDLLVSEGGLRRGPLDESDGPRSGALLRRARPLRKRDLP